MRAVKNIFNAFTASCGGCLFIMLGLTVLAGIYWVHTEQIEFAGIAQTTTGTVIDLRRGTGKNAGYYPTVQFLTRRERLYTFESAMTSDHQIGDKVEVLYNPEAPEEAVIAEDNSITTNKGMWFAIGIGLVFVVVGASPFARGLKQLREHTWTSRDAISPL
jgi:hypothetical protein